MDAICALSQLERLELNAAPAGGWKAAQLLHLPRSLHSLSLLLPDREVVAYILPEWLQAVSLSSDPKLSTLSIMCYNSPVVNTTNLKDISSYLRNITSLTLGGCTRLTDGDVLHAVKSCSPHLRHLALEGISSLTRDFYTQAAPFLQSLESLRTSHPERRIKDTSEYYDGLSVLVNSCPRFNSFTQYLSGDTERGLHPEVNVGFIKALVKSAGRRLVRFEVSGLSMASESIAELCVGAKGLEQLVLPVGMADLVRFLAPEQYLQY